MHPQVGELVFTDGTEAGIVLSHGTDDNGDPDGSLIVGRFASVEVIEQDGYGARPGPGRDEEAAEQQRRPAAQFVPTVGGSEPERDEAEAERAAADAPVLTGPARAETQARDAERYGAPIAEPPSEADVQTPGEVLADGETTQVVSPGATTTSEPQGDRSGVNVGPQADGQS